ncbi:cyanophycinase [Pseudochryseolinea flava]|uniref:Cyanophycinase n=1 Tax=Pseudochryseolinea flava TaxID=2059302 RepID=A0A364XXN8_9BACT|nr:cyanophycinase [Pseudochryseolinea flava]RAV98176.1 cyanophycinase [Pseudochryseolinea flava]
MKGILALCFLLSYSISSFSQAAPKGKLFIIGGGSRPDSMVERIIQEADLRSGGYAIILPMSSIEPDSAVYYASQQFLKANIKSIRGVHFVKGQQWSAHKLDSVRNAKLIYISGGDQNRFMDVVLGTEIEKAIHDAYQKGSVIAGTSAGAAVMSKIMITGNELKHPDYSSTFQNIEEANIETKQGLGLLTSVIIDQHFVARSRYNRLISAVIEFPQMKGIGIDESTAILVKGNEVEVVGDSQVIVIENPKQSKKVTNNTGKLGATGLQLSVLLPGDKFKIK